MYWRFMRDFYQASPVEGTDTLTADKAAQDISDTQHHSSTASATRFLPATMTAACSEGTLPPTAMPIPQTLQAACIYSTDTGFSRFSSNWETTCFLPAHLCKGDGWIHCFSKSGRKQFQHAVKTLQQNHMTQSIRCEVHCGMDTSHWMSIDLSLIPSESEESEKLEILCVAHCIDELIATQQEMQKFRAEAELANRNRSQFLANMSHELRTPLNAIIGFSQILQSCGNDYDEATHADYLYHIQESGYLLLNKIRDLLDIAEIDAGNLRMREEEVNLSDLVEDALTLHASQIQEKQLKLEKSYSEKSVVLKADRAKLTQALSHLLANAVNFSEHGATLWLRAEITSTGGLALSVQDEGTGIRTEHLEAIREGLAQPNAVFATDPRGIRLGLALAKEFTHLHDGNLTLFSSFGEGTLASISLPPSRIMSVGVRIRHKLNAMRAEHHQPKAPVNRAAKPVTKKEKKGTTIRLEKTG